MSKYSTYLLHSITPVWPCLVPTGACIGGAQYTTVQHTTPSPAAAAVYYLLAYLPVSIPDTVGRWCTRAMRVASKRRGRCCTKLEPINVATSSHGCCTDGAPMAACPFSAVEPLLCLDMQRLSRRSPAQSLAAWPPTNYLPWAHL
ncbi:hypothetical protein COCMIDRAFT_102717 [Bipolaris oryzae ATCC 44560]|uniref:Uncharacterized protein n=1 Tax=Bipolaris oryzae ATCC 44560 TaxID=930090 RepID=W6YYQ9_COCMI|nr:uncharacterized protein COCMIDRAFT_102717 [Bipolaris oryzae ATCC 44560]EUC42713.1 hypothetical protein COCMIDRAFT_102717 [Bipolaris oryzae ATCC 44560]